MQFAKDQVVPLLQSVSSLRQIGIYGSVAQGTARPNSDIDLIIVCQHGFLHLCRWQVNWRIWRNGLRDKVSTGVVVCESALKPETFQVNKHDKYADRWFKDIKWIYKTRNSLTRNSLINNWIAKLFFQIRFNIDSLKRYPAPHIKFSDEVFFHFGDSRAKQNVKIS